MYRYKTVKRGGKTVLLHRQLMAARLGRPLAEGEEVHHRNEDTHDNRIENLEVLPAPEHRQRHADERLVHPRVKVCEVCATEFVPHPTKRKRAKTCSWGCRAIAISRSMKGRPKRKGSPP